MSARERYIKVCDALVEGDSAKASELLHEAFVERAREIWSDLVEQDDIVEDDIAEEDLEEAIGDEQSGDFIDDIESEIEEDEDEIEAEEAFGEADEEEMDAELELADADAEEMDMEDGDDMDAGDHDDMEDALVNVEDALADLKATFAELMGGDADEEAEEEMEEELAFESDEAEEEIEEAADEEAEDETLEEAAELTKVGKDGMHPADMPAGDDGKASPVAGENDMGGEAVDMAAKGSEGSDNGLVDAPKDMNVTHPGDGADMKAEPKGHGAEKKGAAE